MERDASPGRAVGRLLRDQRLARELSIDDVAACLRIRTRYLEAIEQGRFDQLPGAAYIPAFLRAYANHIGLDADKVMTAYQLSGPVPIERPVTLPADFPLVEKRAPIGLAVLTVLLVIGAGYAVWHYLPRQQLIVSEKVPPVPDRLMATPAPATQPAPPPAVEPATVPPSQEAHVPVAPAPVAAVPAAAPAAARPAAASVATPPSPAPTPAAAAANEVWPAPKQEIPAARPASAPPAVVTAPPSPPPVVMPMPAIGQAQAAQAPVAEAPRPTPPSPAPVPAPVTQEAVARGAADPATSPFVAATPATPPMQSDTKVFARSNSWIELRGPAGDVLTQTYVRAGESYTVPAGIAYRIIDAR
jgi:cytoskeleton protein RodZ